MNELRKATSSFLIGAALTCSVSLTADDTFWSENAAHFSKDEARERNVDEAALSSQKSAVQTLNKMIVKVRNRPEEARYLFKLAEILQQSASMDFRVGMGRKHPARAEATRLKGFKSDLRASIETLDRLIHKFPQDENAPKAYFMRGRAYQELDHVKNSSRDFRHLTSSFPAASECIPAYLSLADFALNAQRPEEAVRLLRLVKKHPASPYYPFALYQLAWAYYGLKQVQLALQNSEELVAYYRAKGARSDRADLALLENILKDVPLFFFLGYEMGPPGSRAADALAFYRKIAGKAPADLTLMLSLYAKLLRSNDHSQELRTFNQLVIASEIDSTGNQSDGYALLLTELEHDLNQSRYESIGVTSRSLISPHQKAKSAELVARAEKLVFEGALKIQSRFAKEVSGRASSPFAKRLASTLTSLYSTFFKMVDNEDDSRVRTAHSNLGETLFATGDFEGATAQYRWLASTGSKSDPATASAGSKAIASRSEFLRKMGLIPRSLKATPLSSESPRVANPLITEWIEWMDAQDTKSKLDHFIFDGNRALYEQGKIRVALDRLQDFAFKNHRSPVAAASITLVVDTYVVSQDWKSLAQFSQALGDHETWKNTALQKKVATLASDAHFKRAQMLSSQGSYDEAIAQIESFGEMYKSSTLREEGFALAGDAALAKKDRGQALHYYSLLVERSPKGERAAKTLLLMAKMEEESFSFSAAAQTYYAYLIHPFSSKKLQNDLKIRALTLSWIGGNVRLARSLLSDRGFCSQNKSVCERHRALMLFMGKETATVETSRSALKWAQIASPETRAIYATLALDQLKALSILERRLAISALTAHWDKVDPLTRTALIARVTISVPKIFQLERAAMARLPISTDEKSITRRLNLIKDFEMFGTQVSKLPWAGIHSQILEETANAYSDFSIAIRNIPAPKNMSNAETAAYSKMIGSTVFPFDKKATQLKQQALAINPQPEFTLDSEFLKNAEKSETLLQRRWAEAIDGANWPQVAFFSRESRRLAAPWTAAAGKAVSLAKAGAQNEAQLELKSYCQSHRSTAESAMRACASMSVMPRLAGLPKIKRSKVVVGRR